MSKIIVLMGAPGAGKGTQARLLQERLHLPQISTGDMFRALKEEKTPLADEVRALMEAGKLVPDDLTIRVVRERTAQADCKPRLYSGRFSTHTRTGGDAGGPCRRAREKDSAD